MPLATDRDGLPTLEGLRAWAAAQVAALNDKVSGPMMAPVIKAIEVSALRDYRKRLCSYNDG